MVCKRLALLRGMTPLGQNRILKMASLVEILDEAGLKKGENLYPKWQCSLS